MKVRALSSLSFLFMTSVCWANTEGHIEAIPWKLIVAQSVNLGALLILLGYLCGAGIRQFFAAKKTEYEQTFAKAKAERNQAERALKALQQQLAELQSGLARELEKAQSEAERLSEKQFKEAEQAAQRMQKEAERLAEFEIMKAKSLVRDKIVDQAVVTAERKLVAELDPRAHERLNTEFIGKIQVMA
jgi:F0F1-type ATP synthase membrane subunit b/b'